VSETVTINETGISLVPDQTRVITRFFVPGREEVGPGDSRAGPVLERILGLDEDAVDIAMRDIDDRFSHRHPALHDTLVEHADLATSRLDQDTAMSPKRRLLVGAAFTHEYSIEGAALCNPSAVPHPHQPTNGDAAFVLSVRAIGEGHRSSIGFRTGVVTATGNVTIDPPGPYPRTASASPGIHHRDVIRARLAQLADDNENASYVLDSLPERFDDASLTARIDALAADSATRRHTTVTIAHLRALARSSYRVDFPTSTDLSERVLWPHAPAELNGMEDARFVRFLDEEGRPTYYATYTAFDGVNVAQHLLETADFTSFAISPLAGAAATGKGLALFPRRINGSFMALSRADRETNSLAVSDDLRCWNTARTIQTPTQPWEILQLGNCGSPIETTSGWLVLTHGVGPMRTYALGAILLDLDEPHRVLAHSNGPIIAPGANQRDGYVPNVVYSCGAFAHGDVLVLPYGVGDQAISIVTLSIAQLLGALCPNSDQPAMTQSAATGA
jgi:predicted GH43/DUF377 family glycosyl hydrolase